MPERKRIFRFICNLFIYIFIYNYNLFFLVQRVCGVNFLKSVNKLNHCNKFPHFRLTCPRSTKDCCYNSRCLWSTVQNHPPFDVLKCLKHCWNLCMFATVKYFNSFLSGFSIFRGCCFFIVFHTQVREATKSLPHCTGECQAKGHCHTKGI